MPHLDNVQEQLELVTASVMEDLKAATIPQWALDLAYFSDREHAAGAVDYPWAKISGQMEAAPEGVQGGKTPPKTYITRVSNDRKQLSIPIAMSSLRRASGIGYTSMMAKEAVTAGINRLTYLVINALQNGSTIPAYDALSFFNTGHETGANTATLDVVTPAAPTEEELLSAVADAMVLIMGQRDGETFLNRGFSKYRVVLPFKYLKAANNLFTSANIVEVMKSVLSTEQRGRVDGADVQYSLEPALTADEIFVSVTDSSFKPFILQREYEEIKMIGPESETAIRTGMVELVCTQFAGLESWRYERMARIQLV